MCDVYIYYTEGCDRMLKIVADGCPYHVHFARVFVISGWSCQGIMEATLAIHQVLFRARGHHLEGIVIGFGGTTTGRGNLAGNLLLNTFSLGALRITFHTCTGASNLHLAHSIVIHICTNTDEQGC